MKDLTIIKQNDTGYIDSREVAEVIGKQHGHLMRDIHGYVKTMGKVTQSNFGVSDFFSESTYADSTGRTLPCYLISKMGCELVANKLTGEKGVLFTVAYVSKFNAMEAIERAELEARASMPIPRLGEYNAASRIIIRALQKSGVTSDRVIEFIKGVYEPLGFSVVEEYEIADIPSMYTAKQIAAILGIYSRRGNPHYQAVACLLNENLCIDDAYKSVVTMDYGSHIGVCVRYGQYALHMAENWLYTNGFPCEIDGNGRTYHVVYEM